jgi:hypothetical protein
VTTDRESFWTISPEHRYSDVATDIIFRQPYNTLGYAFSFSFEKSYFASFSPLQMRIENNSNEIADAFTFDTTNYNNPRPLIEIRAGYTELKIKNYIDRDFLKQELPLIYSGFPSYYNDSKTRGGRNLVINLSDMHVVNLSGKLSRVTARYPAGMKITDVVIDLCNKLNVKYDVGQLVAVDNIADNTNTALSAAAAGANAIFASGSPDISGARLKNRTAINDLWYNNRLILTDVLPTLGRQYGFYLTVYPDGTHVFLLSGVPAVGALIEVSASTGLIEYPTMINWTHWTFQTLFNAPACLYPGEWVKLRDPYFLRNEVTSKGDYVTGAIVSSHYQWSDSTARCRYVLAPEGKPVESVPRLEQ